MKRKNLISRDHFQYPTAHISCDIPIIFISDPFDGRSADQAKSKYEYNGYYINTY